MNNIKIGVNNMQKESTQRKWYVVVDYGEEGRVLIGCIDKAD